MSQSAPLNATLIARRDLDERHTVFTIAPDHPIPFAAGQWTEMGLPRVEDPKAGPVADEFVKDGVVRRAYSIASAPGEEHLRFFFNRVEDGQLTRWLWALQPGDRLYVDPEVRGHFTLDGLPEGADLLLVATGTGVAPFHSMLQHYAASEERPWRRAMLLHGARHSGLLGFRKELQAISAAHNHLAYLPCLSRQKSVPPGFLPLDESASPGPSAEKDPAPRDIVQTSENGPEGSTPLVYYRGRVTDLLREPDTIVKNGAPALDPAHCHVYLCGSGSMIRSAEDALMKLGFEPTWANPEGTIHTEVYY